LPTVNETNIVLGDVVVGCCSLFEFIVDQDSFEDVHRCGSRADFPAESIEYSSTLMDNCALYL